MKIFLVGDILSGKSSLLNAFAGGIVSSINQVKENVSPTVYEFDQLTTPTTSNKRITELLESKQSNINKSIVTVTDPKPIVDLNGEQITFRSNFGLGKCFMYDFCGLNDVTDTTDSVIESIKSLINQCDLMLFVTNAETAFLNRHELETFNKISKLCQNSDIKTSVRMCIIVSKLDTVSDINFDSVIDRIKSTIDFEIDIFRTSGHRLLIENIVQNKLSISIPNSMYKDFPRIIRSAPAFIIENTHGQIAHSDFEFFEDPDTPIPTWKYAGDWDNFTNYLKERIATNDEYQSNVLTKVLNEYLSEIAGKTNIKTGTGEKTCFSSAYTQKCSHFPKIVELFRHRDMGNKLIELCTDFFTLNVQNRDVCMSFIMSLFDSKIDVVFKERLLEWLEERIDILMGPNHEIPEYYFHMFRYGLSKCDAFIVCPDLMIEMLKNPRVWTTDEIYYWSINRTANRMHNSAIDDNPTRFINSIMNHHRFDYFSNYYEKNTTGRDIHTLIQLSMMKPKHLSLLDVDNKLPYDLIKKYLGEDATLRTRIYMRTEPPATSIVPYLFNEDPTYDVNKKIVEYREVLKKLSEIK